VGRWTRLTSWRSAKPRERVTARHYTYIDLFRGKYARRTLINSLYWVMLWLGTGAIALLNMLLVREGFSLQTTLAFGIVATLVSAPGYWVSAYMLERLGRKPTLYAYACAAAAAYCAVVHTVDPTGLIITLLVINFCTIRGVGAVYTYLSEQYPTEIRTTATSLVNVLSRIELAPGAVVVGTLI
jgi:MFS transporter, putative metabolite:H+ symporter